MILEPGSEGLRTWLDPQRYEWSQDLQSLLKPFNGELEIYPVSKGVGKVGNNSPLFIVPLNSRENKSNIANFFSTDSKPPADLAKPTNPPTRREGNNSSMNTSDNIITGDAHSPAKRKLSATGNHITPPRKKASPSASLAISKSIAKNNKESLSKPKLSKPQKITKFF